MPVPAHRLPRRPTWSDGSCCRGCPSFPEKIAEELVRIIGVLRDMQLKKVPSVAETIDWGRTVLALGMDTIDDEMIAATLGVVLKHQSDQVKASGELRLN